ncbi:MAG TPA: hypothetical protein VNK03_05760 [Gammaproteobacteria bacterium]|nr:hypothetical protein [Gammaproteobacteria bacterium]
MSIKPIEEQFQAIQLKYNPLKDSRAPFTAISPTPMQFKILKPSPAISVKTSSEKNESVEQTMLKYILKKYGKQGENILSQREENLLPFYIEGYLLKQNFTDPNGEFHTILQLVHEAGERTLGTRSCSAMRSLR